jgi:hypothetical protein
MLQREWRIASVIRGLSPEVQRFLLEAIMSPVAERVELIGRLHKRAETPELVELLIDLEQDRLPALEVAEALKAVL